MLSCDGKQNGLGSLNRGVNICGSQNARFTAVLNALVFPLYRGVIIVIFLRPTFLVCIFLFCLLLQVLVWFFCGVVLLSKKSQLSVILVRIDSLEGVIVAGVALRKEIGPCS